MAATGKSTKSNTRKKSAPRKNEQEMMGRQVAGLIVIGVGILALYLLLSGQGGAIREVLLGTAGVLAYLLPLIIVWIGVLILFSGKRTASMSISRIVLLAVLLAILFAGVHVFVAPQLESQMRIQSLTNFVAQSYALAVQGGGGAGAIGAILSYPLYSVLGGGGSFIVLIILLLADLVLMGKLSLIDIGEKTYERVRSGVDSYRAHREEWDQARAVKAEERAQKKEERREQRARRQAEEDWAPWEDDGPQMYQDEEERTATAPKGADIPEFLKRKRGKKPVLEPSSMGDEFEDFGGFGEMEPPTVAPVKAAGGASSRPHTVAPIVENTAMPKDIKRVPKPEPMPNSVDEDDVGDLPDFKREPPVRGESHFADEVEEGQDLPDSAGEDEIDEMEEEADEEGGLPLAQDELEEEDSDLPAAFEIPAFRTPHRKQLGKMISPVEDDGPAGNPAEAEEEEIPERLDRTPVVKPKPAAPAYPTLEFEPEEYNYPPVDLLQLPERKQVSDAEQKDQIKAQKLEETLHSFGISAKLTGIAHGPAVTRFEMQPAPGIKVSRIVNLADDIALNLAATSVRIEAPIPGKPAIGVEVPNEVVETVPIREVLESDEARRHPSRLAVALGKDNGGRYIIADIAKMPHVLIAGATGSGKSVCINSIICSILYRATPEEVRLIMVDPKVVELSVYNGIPHLLVPVVTDPKKAAGALNWAVLEMTDRYKRFADRGVRDMKGYNRALQEGEKPLPQIVVIIDELADLMMVSPGEVEEAICRLAQLARAAGIHLVIATQRPSVNVITGVIKANIPSRIAFTVASQVDSRTILDVGGAEKLLGRGDMLYAPAGTNKPQRVQGTWVSDEEVHDVVEYIKARHTAEYNEDIIEHMDNAESSEPEEDKALEEHDELLPQAVEIVVESGQASISMLQRRLRIGYARAGRLIDDMASRGIVSQSEGAKPRNVLITREQFHAMFQDENER